MQSFELWQGDVPGKTHLEVPMIHYYAAPEKKGRGTVIIFPGGGYSHRAAHEGEGYAEFLNEFGLDAFVVDYRVTLGGEKGTYPDPVLDARRAVRFVRANAEKFGIDPDHIAVMGSSAGGHLAALVSTYTAPLDGEGVDEMDKVDFLPNAQILCYPVMDNVSHNSSYTNLLGDNCTDAEKDTVTPMLIASESTPMAFIWHTSTDNCVDVNGSFRYAARLHELKVSVEMHVYPVGGHGLGLGYYEERNIDVPYIKGWADNLTEWLKLNKYL